MPEHDPSTCTPVAIVGGGLCGYALALALKHRGIGCTVLEATSAGQSPPGFDERFLAVNRVSVRALAELGVDLASVPEASPIAGVVLCSQGEFGRVVLHAHEHALPDFGLVLPARQLGARLAEAVARARIDVLRPWPFASTRLDDDRRQVLSANAAVLHCRLLVGADGSDSTVAAVLGLGRREHAVAHTALVANVTLSADHRGMALERLTREGAVALLPQPGRRAGCVWTVPNERARALLSLADTEYREALQAALGWSFGAIERVGVRRPHPLRHLVATEPVAARAVLIGNAALTLPPLGAQGFNLGLRDALALAARIRPEDPGAIEALIAHAAGGRRDRDATATFATGILATAIAPGPLAGLSRLVGLAALAHTPTLRRHLVRFGIGLRPRAG